MFLALKMPSKDNLCASKAETSHFHLKFARPKNFQHFTNFFSKDDDQTHLSTSCEALSEMAEKMLSKVLWGPTSSAFEKCVTEVALETLG